MTPEAPDTAQDAGRQDVAGAQRILVIRAGALGDCLLMWPALAALRARFPRAQIDVMGYPTRWAWVVGRGVVDRVQAIEQPGMHLLFSAGTKVPAPLQRFFAAYDIILSYRPDPDHCFTTNLRRLGARLVLSHAPFPPPPPPTIHVADFALRLLAQVGAPPLATFPRLQLMPTELSLVEPFFSASGVDPRRQPIVVLHPGSGSPAKRWPIICFAALAEALMTQAEVRPIVIAGYAEQGVATQLLDIVRGTTLLVAEDWPLIPTAALIAHATVFIGNDSGLTHLAAALGRPTVAIFGPTDPEIWGPRGEHVMIVRSESQPELTCGLGSDNKPTADLLQVLQAVHGWLTGQHPT